MMWRAMAEYGDGSTVERLFEYDERKNDGDQQYEIETWLIERKPGCVWYSVDFEN